MSRRDDGADREAVIHFMGGYPFGAYDDVMDHDLVPRLLYEQGKRSDYSIESSLDLIEDLWRQYAAEDAEKEGA